MSTVQEPSNRPLDDPLTPPGVAGSTIPEPLNEQDHFPPEGTPNPTGGPRCLIPLLVVIATVAGLVALWSLLQVREAAAPGTADAPIRLGADYTGESESSDDSDGLRGFKISPERPAPDFRLTDQHGEPVAMSDLRGNVVLLFFGFTHCPDICPTTLLTLGRAIGQLDATAAELVKIVFISVDPERDTPETIGKYVAVFHEDAIGLTGELDAIETVAESYGVRFEKEWPEDADRETDPYFMAHSTTVFVIDPFGQLRSGFFAPTADEVAHDVTWLLEEG